MREDLSGASEQSSFVSGCASRFGGEKANPENLRYEALLEKYEKLALEFRLMEEQRRQEKEEYLKNLALEFRLMEEQRRREKEEYLKNLEALNLVMQVFMGNLNNYQKEEKELEIRVQRLEEKAPTATSNGAPGEKATETEISAKINALNVSLSGVNDLAKEARNIALEAQVRSSEALLNAQQASTKTQALENTTRQNFALFQQQSDTRYAESQKFFRQSNLAEWWIITQCQRGILKPKSLEELFKFHDDLRKAYEKKGHGKH